MEEAEPALRVTGWGPFRLPGERKHLRRAIEQARQMLALTEDVMSPERTDIRVQHVDEIAGAIYEAHRGVSETGRWWSSWAELADKDDDEQYGRNVYRRMAQAAIDALSSLPGIAIVELPAGRGISIASAKRCAAAALLTEANIEERETK